MPFESAASLAARLDEPGGDCLPDSLAAIAIPAVAGSLLETRGKAGREVINIPSGSGEFGWQKRKEGAPHVYVAFFQITLPILVGLLRRPQLATAAHTMRF